MAYGKKVSGRTVLWLGATLGCSSLAGNAQRLASGPLVGVLVVIGGLAGVLCFVQFFRSYTRD